MDNHSNSAAPDSIRQFDEAFAMCRDIYVTKLQDYGASWRVMRPMSLTDQLFIKAKRIRTLETKGGAMVDEGIMPEFVAIVNYGIMAMIQMQLGPALKADITPERATELYDSHVADTRKLLTAKNHDYDEAWRDMRVCSFTDIILTKLQRIKEIEANGGQTIVSEGIESNYQDIVNYAVFAIIKLTESPSALC